MKCKIEDNHLLIYYENGELKEDATENQNECPYCLENKNTCNASQETRRYDGQFCDLMKCKFDEK